MIKVYPDGHPIRCAGSPKESGKEYQAILRAYFGSHGAHLDLMFLGLGENGHTASLFPDTARSKSLARPADRA